MVHVTLLFFYPFYGWFDPLYLMLLVPGMLIASWAQWKVQSTFARYQSVPLRSGMSGADVAKLILHARGLDDVTIEPTRGFLSDHYDPRSRVLRLSEASFGSRSVAAAGVAAHEAGHALQHADRYAPLQFRSAIVPAVQIGSSLSWVFLMLGIFLATGGSLLGRTLILIGLGAFSLSLVFALVTLPVEINASRRALQLLTNTGILQQGEEEVGARRVLTAAAYTYLAALIVAALQFLYFLLRALPYLGGGRRND